MNSIGLFVEVPVASFRMSYAREYAESYEVPPPATVYGMLLSLVGEEDRYRHIGTRVAIARPTRHYEPARSVVLRTFRRIKKKPIGDPTNARPDFQEVLTGVYLTVWVNSNNESGPGPRLVERLQIAFNHPETIQRFGGLSLGESRDLINCISRFSDETSRPTTACRPGDPCRWLKPDDLGAMTMPFWVDHVGSAGTRWASYRFDSGVLGEPAEECWTEISPVSTR